MANITSSPLVTNSIHPASASIVILNRNDKPDLTVTNTDSNRVSLFDNNSNGFNSLTTLATNNSFSSTIGNFNRNDKLNSVVTNAGVNTVSVFSNKDSGFNTPISVIAENYPGAVVLSNFNRNSSDTLIGLDARNTLAGDSGVNTFACSQRTYSRGMEVNHITGFQQGVDKIALNRKTFDVRQRFSFASVKRDSLAATSRADIVYSRSSGALYYNANGADTGFGDGGKFAIVQSNAPLTRSDMVLTSLR
jgi:hypothetical protein